MFEYYGVNLIKTMPPPEKELLERVTAVRTDAVNATGVNEKNRSR